jgi:glycosyltransferase involved in cell wall biosynthesis
MHVVILDGDVSYPPTSGKRLRTLHLMLPLAGKHRITYLARGGDNPEEDRQAIAFLSERGIEPIIVPAPLPPKNGAAFHARLAANLFSTLPYSVVAHRGTGMGAAVREFAAAHAVDVWQVEWSAYLDMVDARSKRLLVAHNVDTLIWQRYHEAERGALKRWYIRRQWRKFEAFERQAFGAATRVVAVSAEDAALVRARFDQPAVDVVDNGVDVPHFAEVAPRPGSRRILFLGSLEWRPNLDGVGLMLDRVFPEVQRQEPGAELVIVGRNPPAGLAERVRGLAGVSLRGNVPDVRPFLADSAVMAVPLRIGGGSRLKILEALASGLPVVSTAVGAEGLCLTPEEHYTRVDGVEGMAEALVRVLRRPEEALAQAARGREVVRERYDWPALAAKLEGAWERCLGG